MTVKVPEFLVLLQDFFSWDIVILNVGGNARCRILAISMNAFVASFPYVNLGIFCAGAYNISMISVVACFKYMSGIVTGKGTCCRKILLDLHLLYLMLLVCINCITGSA